MYQIYYCILLKFLFLLLKNFSLIYGENLWWKLTSLKVFIVHISNKYNISKQN